MIQSLLLTVLTTALIVNTWTYGSIFMPIKVRLGEYTKNESKPRVLRTLAFGPTCQYCFSHWVGVVVTAFSVSTVSEFALLVAPTIWLAAHSITVYNAMTHVPELLRTLTLMNAAKARAIHNGVVEI